MDTRRFPLLRFPQEEIERLVRISMPAAQLASAELVTMGGANTNYRITLKEERDPLALRIVVRDPASCAKEAHLLARLAGLVPVPRVVYSEFTAQSLSYP